MRGKKDFEPRQMRILRPGSLESKERGGRRDSDEGGRRAVIILFVGTILLSLLFWLQGNLKRFLDEFFGPSTWTFTR